MYYTLGVVARVISWFLEVWMTSTNGMVECSNFLIFEAVNNCTNIWGHTATLRNHKMVL